MSAGPANGSTSQISIRAQVLCLFSVAAIAVKAPFVTFNCAYCTSSIRNAMLAISRSVRITMNDWGDEMPNSYLQGPGLMLLEEI